MLKIYFKYVFVSFFGYLKIIGIFSPREKISYQKNKIKFKGKYTLCTYSLIRLHVNYPWFEN
jgi:hypothetical protein